LIERLVNLEISLSNGKAIYLPVIKA